MANTTPQTAYRASWQRQWGWSLKPLSAFAFLLLIALVYGGAPPENSAGKTRLRLGYFPNITHAPALIGVARGTFGQQAGDKVNIETRVFNDGPTAMEALLAGEIDIAYVGPGPAINTFRKSQGRALRIVAGACSGGALLIARPEARVGGIRDLDGKRIGVPQLGGTQDISLRSFLAQNGLAPREKGGTVEIVPVKNPDILALFKQKQLDAAWTQEPWATRIVKEAGAQYILDERDLWPDKKLITTVIVARTAFAEQKPELVQAIVSGHNQTLKFIQSETAEAQKIANGEIQRLTGKSLPNDVLTQSWRNVEFVSDPNAAGIERFAQMAVEAGYAKKGGSVGGIVDNRFWQSKDK
jgi:NitT/TauT family transport system substrate-binding protein